jgi:hypothetical protein
MWLPMEGERKRTRGPPAPPSVGAPTARELGWRGARRRWSASSAARIRPLVGRDPRRDDGVGLVGLRVGHRLQSAPRPTATRPPSSKRSAGRKTRRTTKISSSDRVAGHGPCHGRWARSETSRKPPLGAGAGNRTRAPPSWPSSAVTRDRSGCAGVEYARGVIGVPRCDEGRYSIVFARAPVACHRARRTEDHSVELPLVDPG